MTADLDALLALAPVLTALALVDALSLGALAVPVWLLAAPGRLRTGRVLLYLGTLAGFYVLVGIALLLGVSAVAAMDLVDTESPVFRAGLFAAGAALLVASFVIDPGGGRRRRRSRSGAGRLSRWRDRALGAPDDDGRVGSLGPVIGLALAAGVLEVVTMVPYLGAVGVLSASPLPLAGQIAALAGYCLVMIAPALLLAVFRVLFRDALTPLLRRLDRWFVDHGTSTTAWLLGIVGVVLMVHNVRFVHEVLAAAPVTSLAPGLL